MQRYLSVALALLITLASFGAVNAQVPTSGLINANANIRSGRATTIAWRTPAESAAPLLVI